ncbi:MAG: DUF6941 family protein [Acidimicrobiales bacterium]
MKSTIDVATLAATATYRDGLLSILEAGIDNVTVDQFPFTWAPTLVIRVFFENEELGVPHTIHARVRFEDDEPVADIGWTVTPERGPSADMRLPYSFVVIHALPVQLLRAGVYRFAVSLDTEQERELRVSAAARLPSS